MNAPTISQILVTVTHDGRYTGLRGQSILESFVSGRAWTLDGVTNANAAHCGTTNNHFVTIPVDQYNKFIERERIVNETVQPDAAA